MKISEYISTNNLFEFDSLKCIRNDYYHNKCSECIDICPKESFVVVQNKLTYDSESCISCAACIGGCPSEALGLVTFDQNRFILEFKEQKDTTLSCKSTTPCLGIFAVEHLISAVLRKNEDVFMELGHCLECEIDKESKISNEIKERIKEANRFLEAIGIKNQVKIKENVSSSRRGVFKKILSSVKEFKQEEKITDEYKKQSSSKVPFKTTILKNSLKALDDFNPKVDTSYSFLQNKTIEKGCNNCKECVQFCPTEALFFSSDFSEIYFSSGKCIGCQICNDICKESVVKNVEGEFDLIDFVFDRAKPIIKHDMRVCRVCRCAYPASNDDNICDRCAKFERDFSDMFKLASEE